MKRQFLSSMIIWIIFLTLCSHESLISQEIQDHTFNPEKKFSGEQLKQDFLLFKKALEEGHAGLDRYTPKEELGQHFEAIEKELNRSMTEYEFYRMLVPLIAHIHDGHTRISLSEAFDSHLSNQPILFPFNLRFLKKKAYLFRNYSDVPEIAMGSELLSINGHPLPIIIQRMLPLIPNDAHIQTSKYRRLERTPFFGGLFNLIFGPSTSYEMTYRDRGTNSSKKITVAGIKAKDLTSILDARYPEAAEEHPPIQLDYRKDIAILTVRTFAMGPYRSAKISYPAFLKNAFQELEDKKIQHLIIDLRDNGGGADAYGKILFQHLIDKPFQYYEHLRINNTEFSFFEHTNVPPSERIQNPKRFQKNEEGTFDLLFHPNLGEQKPILPIFQGKVYVLINGNSFSGTGECTSLMHFHKKAVFIGEECGSGYYGNTSGFMPQLTLPNTKIRVRIPLIRYTMAVSGYPKDRGIIPDYPVSPSIDDLLNGRDTVMEFTIDLIQND
jgi:C-terminal processing protease CtpA/Prc